MEQFEREATIGSADSTSLPGGGLPTAIDSLTHLESYYQSKYEHYLAMATEAKENRERVELLLLDLGRDVSSLEDDSIESSLSNGRPHNGSASHRSLDPERVIQELPSVDPQLEPSPAASVVNEKRQDPSSVEQMKRWTLDLFKAMSVIESVSNSDSGKTLHQNYLHHLINRELNIELSEELVELYLEEAVIRGYLELDEFDNNCYRGKPPSDSFGQVSELPSEDLATDKAIDNEQLDPRESTKPYDLPESDKLKPTLFETIEGYIALNPNKRFSIDDVINYLYPQHTQLDWDKALKNKVRASISNVLGRKAYLDEHWSRIKPGVYRPRRSK